jgi:hypothetical protein
MKLGVISLLPAAVSEQRVTGIVSRLLPASLDRYLAALPAMSLIPVAPFAASRMLPARRLRSRGGGNPSRPLLSVQHTRVNRFLFGRVKFDEAAFCFAVRCLTNEPAFLGCTIVV